jgi:hypothetical protein
MDIDRQRIEAVRKLEALGYCYRSGEWVPPSGPGLSSLTAQADAMHRALGERADALMGCTECSPEEAELKAIVDVIEAYEAQRWPNGKEPGGEG